MTMKNSTKNIEFMHNKIMLHLKIHLRTNNIEAYMKYCQA
jgi:hypothetical protein